MSIGWFKPMLLMTAGTYLLTILIQRHGLWFLSLDGPIRSQLGEPVENVAHLFLIVTAFAHLRARPASSHL